MFVFIVKKGENFMGTQAMSITTGLLKLSYQTLMLSYFLLHFMRKGINC